MTSRRDAPFAPLFALVVSLFILMGAMSAGAQSSADGAGTVIAAYTVIHGSPAPDPGVSTSAGRRRLYDAVETYVWSALPPDARARVSRLELFVTPSGVEDALDGTATESDDGTSWTLSLDYGEGENAVIDKGKDDSVTFDEVIAHELGHVLSLNQDQRTDDQSLDTYADDESPFTEKAYLNQFYQEFWNGRYPGWSENGGADQASGLFDGHKDDFVTDYAATDPVEDFAESFAYFVLSPKPTGGAVKAEKLRFFYGFPELLKDRQLMRRNLASARMSLIPPGGG
jgi:hypothetical protein